MSLKSVDLDLDTRIRKEESMLKCSGQGMILFGIWTVIRVLLMEYLDPAGFSKIVKGVEETGTGETITEGIVFAIILTTTIVGLLIRTYIGLSAIREGKGYLKRRPTYIIICSLYLILEVHSSLTTTIAIFEGERSLNELVTPVVDISVCLAATMIIISAVKLRRVKRLKRMSMT